MKDLMYSEIDKTLFWVSGYDFNNSNSNVLETIKNLQENAIKLAKIANIDISCIKTAYIEKSRRYKYMRVFYCEIPLDKVPKEAFVFKKENGWTMWKYLTD